MQKVDQLINTKLHRPFTQTRLVPRTQLQEQTPQGLSGPLTVVTAPAGFEETTLVASCVASGGMPVVLLSLDKDDNRARRFLNYLVAALQEALGRTNPEIARQLVVAPGTIKAHAVSIYRKLTVANRTEAVARA